MTDDSPIMVIYNEWKRKQEIENMARDKITDKSNPPKSEWFNGKYRVTPETSKLLQEAVFKDGGIGWCGDATVSYIEKPYIFVYEDGALTYANANEDSTFEGNKFPEKQPPQVKSPQPTKVEPKKEFKVNKWYKCIDAPTGGELSNDKYYEVDALNLSGGLRVRGGGLTYWIMSRFDINSELDYDPNTAQPAGYTVYVMFKRRTSDTYASREYAYKCKHEDYTQYVEYRAFDEDVFAEVTVGDIKQIVKVVRIEALVDPKATKSIIRILPNSVDKDAKESKINTVTVSGYESSLSDIVKVTINRDDWMGNLTAGYVGQWTERLGTNNFKPNDFSITKEESNMSTNNYRKTVTVNLIDRDSALDEKFALVKTFGEFTTSKNSEALIRSIIIDPKNKVAELIAQHNEVRVKQTNKEIMERTGNKVTLEPVEESDLHWEIR